MKDVGVNEASAERQAAVQQRFQELITLVGAAVGEAPAGAIILIHFRESVTFSAMVDPSLPPQAKLNVVDSIGKKFMQIISSFKSDLNRKRAPAAVKG